jgi:antitoxin CcdA
MMSVYDSGAGKKTTTLTVNSDLLAKAKSLDINISALLEQALAARIQKMEKEAWVKETAGPIGIYNRNVEEFGVFSDET